MINCNYEDRTSLTLKTFLQNRPNTTKPTYNSYIRILRVASAF